VRSIATPRPTVAGPLAEADNRPSLAVLERLGVQRDDEIIDERGVAVVFVKHCEAP
jgi:hypothetical protein